MPWKFVSVCVIMTLLLAASQTGALSTKRSCMRMALSYARIRQQLSDEQEQQPRRIAVVGGGMSGLAVAYNLLKQGSSLQQGSGSSGASSSSSSYVSVTVFDPGEPGRAKGASSVAAGLLHPLSPKGKLTWKGEEGLQATLQLCSVAQDALLNHHLDQDQDQDQESGSNNRCGYDDDSAAAAAEQCVVVPGRRILRPALEGTHKNRFTPGDGDDLVKDINDIHDGTKASSSANTRTDNEAKNSKQPHSPMSSPPMTMTTWVTPEEFARELASSASSSSSSSSLSLPSSSSSSLPLTNCMSGASAINGGVVVDTKLYMYGLWKACKAMGDVRWDNQTKVTSATDLLLKSKAPTAPTTTPTSSAPSSPPSFTSDSSSCQSKAAPASSGATAADLLSGFDAVVVCAGAGIRFLPETFDALLCGRKKEGAANDGRSGGPVAGFSRGRSVELHRRRRRRRSKKQHDLERDGGGGDASGHEMKQQHLQQQPPPQPPQPPKPPLPWLAGVALLCGEYVVPVGSDRIVLGATHEHVTLQQDFDAINEAINNDASIKSATSTLPSSSSKAAAAAAARTATVATATEPTSASPPLASFKLPGFRDHLALLGAHAEKGLLQQAPEEDPRAVLFGKMGNSKLPQGPQREEGQRGGVEGLPTQQGSGGKKKKKKSKLLGESAAVLWPPFLDWVKHASLSQRGGKEDEKVRKVPGVAASVAADVVEAGFIENTSKSLPFSSLASASSSSTDDDDDDDFNDDVVEVVVTAGVRVHPKRSHLGKLPIAGRLIPSSPSSLSRSSGLLTRVDKSGGKGSASSGVNNDHGHQGVVVVAGANDDGTSGDGRCVNSGIDVDSGGRNAGRVWALTGLGSRGLVHHAFLAEKLAQAVLSGDDSCIPIEARPK